MTISIITATYNSAATVRDTLESIKQQDYPHIQHIIVDGDSVDDTMKIVGEYPHVARLISEKDAGIYDAMNKGIALASGEIIGILNSDDIYNGDKVISRVMKAFLDPKVDAVYADLQYVKYNNLNKVIRTWHSGYYTKGKFYFGWMPPHPTFFVRKKVYDQVGNFNCTLRSAADYEFMLRVLLKNEYVAFYIHEVLVKMRVGGMSNASFSHRLRANREDREAWRLNNIEPFFFTMAFKPLRKVFQFIFK